MDKIIEDTIDETFINYLATEPGRVLGFLDGLVTAKYMNGVRRDELIEAHSLLHKYVYGNSRVTTI